MRLVRIAIVNVNTTVGAVRSNVDRALEFTHSAADEGATLIALPEQLIGGYMQEDLVQWRAFVDAQRRELDRFAYETRSLGATSVLGLTVARGSHLYSVAALVHGGKVHGLVPKEKLPTYGVFYENRTLARGAPGLCDDLNGVPFGDLVFDMDFGTVGIEVCEDIWSPDGPMRRRCYAGAEIMVNVSASPFRLGVEATRREIISTRSSDNQCTVVYAALVGANDGLIYDGGGYVAQNGRMLHVAPRYREGFTCVTVDLNRTRRLRAENTTWRMDQETFEEANAARVRHVHHVKVDVPTRGREALRYPGPPHKSFFLPEPSEPRSARTDFCEDLLDALALGIGDYFEKTRAFKTIGVALSGGRDSLLCLMLAHRYLARRFRDDPQAEKRIAEILRAFFMPTRYSSAETRAAAEAAAKELGVPLVISNIDDAFEHELAAAKGMLQPGESVTQLTKQNIQARLRAERMWSWSNSAAGLFLQTSNMSEKAVGYTTIGGDMEGALSVIANVPKTVVNYLLDYLFETTKSEAIRLTLMKPASAELADDMEDERDLMPFPVLDACFALYAGEKMSIPEVVIALRSIFPDENPTQLETWATKFGRLFTQSIYKWVQTPLSLHVGNLDLERERALQLPVVQSTEWT
ncbi:NAD(+) synthase [Pendulispora brunnea]|uniref:Glutamine-dependent NAD(+) synthetase n=1 Tax=Pendulispora brunnea TaxID=2905690 RepID=A0ABZ2KI41_9BACT